MNHKVFLKFRELLTKRLDKMELLEIGEDSIRYDFFLALSETEKLEPSDLQLEYKIHPKAFNPRNNKNSKRKEKPKLDLVVNTDKSKINVEFALFRQNSNNNGTINKTYKTVKMLNDMIRLGMDSFNTNRDAYFVCVADEKMLGHQLRSEIIGKFPSNYIITNSLIEKQQESKTSNFDDRFLHVFRNNIQIAFKIIYNEEILAKRINLKTRIIVWQVTHQIIQNENTI